MIPKIEVPEGCTCTRDKDGYLIQFDLNCPLHF